MAGPAGGSQEPCGGSEPFSTRVLARRQVTVSGSTLNESTGFLESSRILSQSCRAFKTWTQAFCTLIQFFSARSQRVPHALKISSSQAQLSPDDLVGFEPNTFSLTVIMRSPAAFGPGYRWGKNEDTLQAIENDQRGMPDILDGWHKITASRPRPTHHCQCPKLSIPKWPSKCGSPSA